MATKNLSILVNAGGNLPQQMALNTRSVAQFADSVDRAVVQADRGLDKLDKRVMKTRSVLELTFGFEAAAVKQRALGLGASAGRGFVASLGGLEKALGVGASAGRFALAGIGGIATAGVGVGLAGLGATSRVVNGEATSVLDELDRLSRRLNVSVEDLSRLRYAAILADADFSSLAGSVATADKNFAQFALNGGGRAADVIRLLRENGLRTTAFGRARSAGELLPEIGDILQRFDPSRRELITQKLFGDGSGAVRELLSGGGQALRRQFDDSDRRGATFTTEEARIAAAYDDEIKKLSASFLRLKVSIAQELQPALTEFFAWLGDRIKDLPAQFGLIGRLIRQLFSANAADREYAEDRLGEILGALKDLATETALEIGVAMVDALVAGIEMALVKAQGRLGQAILKTWREATLLLAPAARGIQASGVAIPQLQALAFLVNPPRSREEELKASIAAESQRLEMLRKEELPLREKIAKLEKETSGTLGQSAASDELDRLKVRFNRTLPRDIDDATASLKKMRSELEELTRASREAEDKASEQFKGVLAGSVRNISAVTAAKVARVMDALTLRGRDPRRANASSAAESGASLLTEGEKLWRRLNTPVFRDDGTAFPLLPSWWFEEGNVSRVLPQVRTLMLLLARNVGTEYAKQRDAIFQRVRDEEAALAADLLEAQGDPRGAERARLVLELERRQRAIETGPLYSRRQIDDVKRLAEFKLQDFDASTKLTKASRELSKATSDYQDLVARNADLVQSGTIQEFQATRMNLEAADALREKAAAARELLVVFERQGKPGIATDLRGQLGEQVEGANRLAAGSRPRRPRTFDDGVVRGFDDLIDRAKDFESQGYQSASRVGDAFVDELGGALFEVGQGFDDLGEIGKQFGVNMLRTIGQVASQVVALRLVLGIAGLFAGGGSAGAGVPDTGGLPGGGLNPGLVYAANGRVFNTSGLVPFERGGIVTRPTVFPFGRGGGFAAGIMGEAGPEAILPLSRGRDGKLGVRMGDGGGAGGGGGGGGGAVVLNVSIAINGSGDPQAVAREVETRLRTVTARVLQDLKVNPGYRADLRTTIG